MRKITIIKKAARQSAQRKRVAAYARVSSGKDAMLHSLSAQISYYNSFIGRHCDWEFAGIYADEAITGTKDTRPEFQRLLAACRSGKIDMVITKSITRFARNTVTLLQTVRELKLLGIDVYFEKENIHSLSTDGEFMLTILSSYAQEESRSVSENQKWRIRKMFAEGRPNTGNMLGYRLFDGKLYIIPEEAEVVKTIFDDYLSGMGRIAIIKKLNDAGISTRSGALWRASTLHKMLRNEKYSGDMMLQKTFSLDHLSKKKQINRGELPMYQVIDSHEAIIDKETFAKVQREIERRVAKFGYKPQPKKQYLFTSLICCGQCGKHYHRKQANAGSKYVKPVWICTTFNFRGKNSCPSQQIPESILLKKTSEVLGTTELDIDLLKKNITRIQIPGHNRIEYIFKDGRSVEVAWEHPSRSESWDEAMRQAARERKLSIDERRHKQ
ncbi:recombinase family protein [Dehalobacter restrictus]|uniref:recombinase family protein n=1 Tax=Dehalobacter restrictus TaxID=55583 RepID=UPI00338D452E